MGFDKYAKGIISRLVIMEKLILPKMVWGLIFAHLTEGAVSKIEAVSSKRITMMMGMPINTSRKAMRVLFGYPPILFVHRFFC